MSDAEWTTLEGVSVDEALRRVGGYRKWHLATFGLLGVTTFVVIAFNVLAVVFIGWTPGYHCSGIENGSLYMEKTSDGIHPSKCYMYADTMTDNVTTSCTSGWIYDEPYHTITSQWDLVCEDAVWSDISQVIYKAGSAVGEVAGAFLMDRFGRKPMHLVGLLAMVVVIGSIALSTSFTVFSLLRFVLGFCGSVSTGSGLVLLIEIFDAQKRDFAAIASEAFWVTGYMMAGLVGYYATSWRIYYAVAVGPCLLGIVYFWVLVESPLWMAARGKTKEAEDILMKIAKWNNIKVSSIRLQRDTQDCLLEEHKERNDKPNEEVKIGHLFKEGVLIKHGIVSVVLWFTNFIVYSFLILASPSFAGGRFLNYFLGGLVEIPAYIFAFFVCKKYGRRMPVVGLHILVALALAALVLLYTITISESIAVPMVMTFVLVGKMAISASFAIIIPYTKELFPTYLRGISGVFVILGQVGAMVAPFLAFVMKSDMKWIPLLIVTLLSLLSGLLSLWLPETFNKPLPQTLKDVHDLYQPPRITSGANEVIRRSPELNRPV